MKDKLSAVAAVTAMLVVLVVGPVVWTSAPCGLWKFSKAGDMPARCIAEVGK